MDGIAALGLVEAGKEEEEAASTTSIYFFKQAKKTQGQFASSSKKLLDKETKRLLLFILHGRSPINPSPSLSPPPAHPTYALLRPFPPTAIHRWVGRRRAIPIQSAHSIHGWNGQSPIPIHDGLFGIDGQWPMDGSLLGLVEAGQADLFAFIAPLAVGSPPPKASLVPSTRPSLPDRRHAHSLRP